MIEHIVKKIVDDHGGMLEFRCFDKLHPRHNDRRSTWVECRINPLFYMTDDYRAETITIMPVAEVDTHIYSSNIYTYKEFVNAIRNSDIVVKTNRYQHVGKTKWMQPLCGDVCLVHEADIVVLWKE